MNLGINPNTVKKAYEELEKNGSIIIVSTKGTFVANKIEFVVQRKIKEKISIIQNEIKELESLGMTREKIKEKIL